MRSLKGRESVTPPGGTWGKSLKRECSSAPSAIQQDPPRTRFPPPPSVSTLPTSPQVSVTRRRGSLETALRSLALSGATTEGGAQVFGRPGEGSFSIHCLLAQGWRGWPQAGPSGGSHPEQCTETTARTQQQARPSHSRVHLVRSGSSDARQLQPAPGRDPGSMSARPPVRPAVAHGHTGRSRSASGQALRSPTTPAPRATPPCPLCSAPLAVPTSGGSLFSHLPVPRPGRLIQCLVINLAFQNGQRAG